MSVVLRSLALLSAAGASAALFIQELRATWLAGYVTSNTLALPTRTKLLIGMVAGAAAAILAGLVAWSSSTRRLRRFAELSAPAILLGFLPLLCTPQAWPSALTVAMTTSALVLLAERLYRMAFAAAADRPALGWVVDAGSRRGRSSFAGPSPSREVWNPSEGSEYDDGAALPAARSGRLGRFGAWAREGLSGLSALFPRGARRWGPPAVVAAAAIGYGIYFSIFTLRMHGRFQTYGYDLGQYDNIFWSTLHGYPLRDAPLGLTKNWHELRNHAELSVFLLLPFYAIKPGAPILLVLQSCILGLGAVPIYRFAARRLPRWYAAAIAVAYLFFPPMHGLQFYDFHFQPIASTFVLFVIDLVDDRRYWLCAFAFIAAIGCREDIPIGLAFLGAFLMLSGYRVRPGFWMAVSATVYFVLMRFVIMPAFGPGWFQGIYKDLLPAGAPGFGGVIATMVSNPVFTFNSLLQPEKLRYALQILLPVAFLPLRRPWLMLSIVPGSIFTLLTTQYTPTIDIAFQYSAHFIPYIFPAAALAIAAYGGEGAGLARRRAALAALLTGTALAGVHWGAIPPRDAVHGGFALMTMRAPTPADEQRERDLRALHAMVPETATLAVSESEMPHISRLEMRTLRDSTDADYLLYASGAAGASNGERALGSGEFEKVAERPGLFLLRRKSTTQPMAPKPAPAVNPGAFPRPGMARPPGPTPSP